VHRGFSNNTRGNLESQPRGIQIEAGGLQPKDTVRVSFQLPVSGVTIEAMGTVVWVKEDRQGIQFTNVSPQNEQSIRKFIAEVEK
jgi:hypothetical protein